jgi:hypothetical protein
MDDVKRGFREAENKTREAGRELDGHDVTDDIGNAGDDIRKELGNAGDATRRTADDVGDRTADEADRRF